MRAFTLAICAAMILTLSGCAGLITAIEVVASVASIANNVAGIDTRITAKALPNATVPQQAK